MSLDNPWDYVTPGMLKATQWTEKPLTTIPDLCGKVIGYRAFCIDRDGGHVRHAGDDRYSLWNVGTYPVQWQRRMTAKCLRGVFNLRSVEHDPNDAPHRDCSCGLHAYHCSRIGPGAIGGPGAWATWGAVAAWGRVEVHHTGFRAQHMELLALGYLSACSNSDLENLWNVAERIGVPALELNRLEAFALEYGSPVPQAIIDGI